MAGFGVSLVHNLYPAEFAQISQNIVTQQQAAADARRRAAEMQRLREEAAYLGQFSAGPIEGNADTSVQDEMSGLGRQESPASDAVNALIGNEPGMVVAPVREETEDVATSSDLDAIRRELKRRQDESQ